MHPAPLRSYGVGSGACGDQGACVTTTLYRGNRALRERTALQGSAMSRRPPSG